MENTSLLRLHVKMAQLSNGNEGRSVRVAELERKMAQLNRRLDEEPRLMRRLGPMLMKLKHDIGHHKRAAKVAIHKAEKAKKEIFQEPVDRAAAERALDRSLEISARISVELAELDRSLDELLAACGPLA
jgi:chromosome segregation ATPase